MEFISLRAKSLWPEKKVPPGHVCFQLNTFYVKKATGQGGHPALPFHFDVSI